MTTWRGVRKELEGAWRSVQYDLARARSRRRNGAETTELIFPEHARPPRRWGATGGFVLVSLAGAVGTYLAVVNGLGALLSPATHGQERPASVVAGADGTGQRPATKARPDSTVRIARQGGPLTAAGRQASAGGAGSSDTHNGVPGGDGPAANPVRPPGAPVPEESDAPGPADPPAPTESPTPAPSETGEPTPSPTPSATDSASPDDQPSDEGRRHHRHHRRDQGENP